MKVAEDTGEREEERVMDEGEVLCHTFLSPPIIHLFPNSRLYYLPSFLVFEGIFGGTNM